MLVTLWFFCVWFRFGRGLGKKLFVLYAIKTCFLYFVCMRRRSPPCLVFTVTWKSSNICPGLLLVVVGWSVLLFWHRCDTIGLCSVGRICWENNLNKYLHGSIASKSIYTELFSLKYTGGFVRYVWKLFATETLVSYWLTSSSKRVWSSASLNFLVVVNYRVLKWAMP